MRATSIVSIISGLHATLCLATDDSWPWQTYKSSSFEPPNLNIKKSGPTAPGYLFFDQSWDAHQYSVFMMSDENDLIWQSPAGDVKDFRVQVLDGEPVLTYFNGIGIPEPFGWGYGIIQILDQSYQSIYNVSLLHDNFTAVGTVDSSSFVSWLDIHESTMTSDNTMLLTGYNVTRADLSSVGGPKDGWIADSLFYEIDVKTNDILFRWSAKDHLDQITLEAVQPFYPIRDWGHNSSAPYGYFHINSVEKFKDGTFLISSRYYCSLFKISKDGTVDWSIEGQTGGDFLLDGVNFAYQHDARIQKETTNELIVSIFDNANSDVENGTDHTEGIFMNVNLDTKKVTPLRLLDDPNDEIFSVSMGAVQALPGDHVLMGYGSNPTFKEYNADGSPVMTVQFGEDGVVSSYRAYRHPWVGIPNTSPDTFACHDASHNTTNVYMSWNGATEVKQWKVFGGVTQSGLFPVGVVPKTGFETRASVKGGLKHVRVEAHGRGIKTGVSKTVHVQPRC
ncbi:uncharacterized protein N7511_004684 [Penicillium nucicola]|uniref:uncharacterized protein n=1 Tax=Penicillium nucicola TaxID=1850975 RepID=UPI0025456CD2|nr:uncharacterized protein N7511_004684 [Penicillium nucicola]KAJ5767068.1 hypothetical protein N7511_004684 [Penicillium nucicola]